jgi:hypothetical protein
LEQLFPLFGTLTQDESGKPVAIECQEVEFFVNLSKYFDTEAALSIGGHRWSVGQWWII